MPGCRTFRAEISMCAGFSGLSHNAVWHPHPVMLISKSEAQGLIRVTGAAAGHAAREGLVIASADCCAAKRATTVSTQPPGWPAAIPARDDSDLACP